MEHQSPAEPAAQTEPDTAHAESGEERCANAPVRRAVALLAMAWSVLTAVGAAAYSAAAIYPKGGLGPDAGPALVVGPAAAAIAVLLVAAARRSSAHSRVDTDGAQRRDVEGPAPSGSSWWLCRHRLMLYGAALVACTAGVGVLAETAPGLRSPEWVSLWVVLAMAGSVAPLTWLLLRELYAAASHAQPRMWASVVLACTAPASAWAMMVSAALPALAAAALGASVPALVLVVTYWTGSWERRSLLAVAGPATVAAAAVLIGSALYLPGLVEDRRAGSVGCGGAETAEGGVAASRVIG